MAGRGGGVYSRCKLGILVFTLCSFTAAGWGPDGGRAAEMLSPKLAARMRTSDSDDERGVGSR